MYHPSKSKIDWADYTWNPVTGCSPASESCDNCYARRTAETRLRGRAGYPEVNPFQVIVHTDRIYSYDANCKGKKIFVCSMSDLMHEQVDHYVHFDIFQQIRLDQSNTYILLTKRPHRLFEAQTWEIDHWRESFDGGDIPKWTRMENVWAGTTVETQRWADERIPYLLDFMAPVHWVSVEPMLEPIDLRHWLKYLDWVVIGAESGLPRRLCKTEWVRELILQCQNADVPVFYKQGPEEGGVGLVKQPFIDGRQWLQFPKQEAAV